jgi:hypothetical protein
MEQWNYEILGRLAFHLVEKKNTAHGRNKPWIEKALIQTPKLCVFDHYSIIPYGLPRE